MPISPEHLAELIDRHWGALMVWVGHCGAGAEDVVQQAFVALAVAEIEPDNPAAWLYTVARTRAINDQKQQQRRNDRHQRVAKPEQTNANIELPLEAMELNEILWNLPDALREIVVARIWGEFSFEEIATMVGSSKATVWRQYELALSQLRRIYDVSFDATNEVRK